MSLTDDLRGRLQAYEAEAEKIRPRLQRLEDLIRSARAILAEEERTGQYPLVPPVVSATPKRLTVPALVNELLQPGEAVRFAQIRDAIHERFPQKDLVLTGKVVNSALTWLLKKGLVERLERGLYRRRNGTA